MHVKRLPSDVIIVIMQYLAARDLAALSETCTYIYDLVNEFGWSLHARQNSPRSFSLSKSLMTWAPYAQVRYHTITDRNWAKPRFVARPLARKWMGKLQPSLAINRSRLLVGAGNTIYSYAFTSSKAGDAPGMFFEGAFTTSQRLQAHRDITSMACVQDGGRDQTLFVGFVDGALERVTLPLSEPRLRDQPLHIDPSYRQRNYFHGDDTVESVSSAGNYTLSLSSGGIAVFMNLSSTEYIPEFLDLGWRGWSTYLSARSSTPYAVFGTSSVNPLSVHDIRASGLSPSPSAILASGTADGRPKQSAVYGIAGAPPSSPWGHSDQIIVSGWYDSLVHVHDLRSSRRAYSADPCCPAPLLPVLSVYDPWLPEPNYSVSCGGGSSSYIAAGTAQHSAVALWDVRKPSAGWSVHAPGNDRSPVYSVVLESSRLFGATQSRPFVLDFGSDVKEDTYPSLKLNHRDEASEGLKERDKTGIGFYVTRYDHSR
ncbi:hypothetical protein DAEQUDRAFT_721422 [Daedalea quercina L-15889]|uniref:F-box domain-containing protein n=1 Tax=Daedalea quercina L-15889 TaxID=1314783 RepID=A0A165TTI2_9APHY|nr:hypothetical protein DAEQUDRAFT_721422 [Daedalea quercina L-15889]